VTSPASRNNRKLPPLRVMVLPIGTGALLALLFTLLLESWVAGAVVGLLFALGFAGVLVMTAQGAARKKKPTRLR